MTEYEEKISALSDHLGADQYVFAFVRPAQHEFYESDKTVEWIVEAQDEDVLAYVDNERWERYLLEGDCPVQDTLRTGFTGNDDWSAILKVPVSTEKVRCKRSYEWKSPREAKLLKEQIF
jgi:hypothetical protein